MSNVWTVWNIIHVYISFLFIQWKLQYRKRHFCHWMFMKVWNMVAQCISCFRMFFTKGTRMAVAFQVWFSMVLNMLLFPHDFATLLASPATIFNKYHFFYLCINVLQWVSQLLCQFAAIWAWNQTRQITLGQPKLNYTGNWHMCIYFYKHLTSRIKL